MTFDDDARDSDGALRDGLRHLPTPTPDASAFDTHVLSALRRPQPLWRRVLMEARPLLAGAACACVVMMAALSWSLQTPPRPLPPPAPAQASRPLDMAAVDRLLDRPGLSAASLVGMTPPRGQAPPPASPQMTPPPPQRRVSQRPAPLMV